jgi:hypothetical protein
MSLANMLLKRSLASILIAPRSLKIRNQTDIRVSLTKMNRAKGGEDGEDKKQGANSWFKSGKLQDG